MTRKSYNQHNNLHISLEFSKNFKNICQNEETLPQNTKKGKLFPNILFGNNVKYSPLHPSPNMTFQSIDTTDAPNQHSHGMEATQLIQSNKLEMFHYPVSNLRLEKVCLKC